MKKSIKYILFCAGAMFLAQAGFTSCSKWTEPEALDYTEPAPVGKVEAIKEYFKTPHKLMYGWFGNWVGKGGSKQYALTSLPDSVDFVSLWLCWGNLTEAQQADLKEFQDRGSRAILCWRAGGIGDNLTPGGNAQENRMEFWGYTPDNKESMIAAAEKYAMAIVDTCRKYNIDGFDYDIEDWGDLMNSQYREVPNAFMKKLRSEFDKDGRMLVADIPGGIWWLSFYDMLDDDVVLSLNHLIWQTYELNTNGFNNFFDAVKSHKPDVFENVLAKSIITASFEEASKMPYWQYMPDYKYYGSDVAGVGIYHIEYDFVNTASGCTDSAYVRKGISQMNPPVNY